MPYQPNPLDNCLAYYVNNTPEELQSMADYIDSLGLSDFKWAEVLQRTDSVYVLKMPCLHQIAMASQEAYDYFIANLWPAILGIEHYEDWWFPQEN